MPAYALPQLKVKPGLPPAIGRRYVLLHRVHNVIDFGLDWLARCWRHRRLVRPFRFHRRSPCLCCGSTYHTFSSRNWCCYCYTRWPEWHASRAYFYPTKLEVWRGADNACGNCGGRFGRHFEGCCD